MEGQLTSLPSMWGTAGVRDGADRARLLGLADRPVALAIVTITALAALVASVGADARWLAALGQNIAGHGAIPKGVPFAAAPTAHWANAIVLGELIFHYLESTLGDRGLMLAQLIAVSIAATLLARDALAGGATRQGTAISLLTAAVGSLGSLAVARAQLFSIALFPVLVALLRSEARNPSRRIWLLVPLMALWSNLHGAVLVGLGVTAIYLVLDRGRRAPWTALAVGAASVLALCLTPAGVSTYSYYHGVLSNEAAARGQGLWQPLSLSAPLDIALIAAAVVLGIRFARSRPRLWELIASAALVVVTVHAARSGVWLLFFLVPPAARAFKPRRLWDGLLPALATVAAAALVLAILRGPLQTGGSATVIDRAVTLAHGSPVLAEDLEAEQVALAGGRVWVGNPIDAFSKRDQDTYLNWLQGRPSGTAALGDRITIVLTSRHSAAQRLMTRQPDFRPVDADRRVELFVRTG